MCALYSRISNFRNWNALINLLFLRQKLPIGHRHSVLNGYLFTILLKLLLISFSNRQLLRSEFSRRSRRQWHSWIFLPWILQIAKMALFDSFKDIYDKIFTTEAVNIDNIVFKLHYRVTVTALVFFSVLLSLGQVSINIL